MLERARAIEVQAAADPTDAGAEDSLDSLHAEFRATFTRPPEADAAALYGACCLAIGEACCAVNRMAAAATELSHAASIFDERVLIGPATHAPDLARAQCRLALPLIEWGRPAEALRVAEAAATRQATEGASPELKAAGEHVERLRQRYRMLRSALIESAPAFGSAYDVPALAQLRHARQRMPGAAGNPSSWLYAVDRARSARQETPARRRIRPPKPGLRL